MDYMIDINNLTSFVIDKKFFTGVAKRVLKGENKERENLSIAFVNKEEIQELNKKYRDKDSPTDVLSFTKVSEFKDEYSEIVICPFVVREKSIDSKLTIKKELANVLIHGILHVLGYDHEKSDMDYEKMMVKQSYYLSKV